MARARQGGHVCLSLLFPSHRLIPPLFQTSIYKIDIPLPRLRTTEQAAQQPDRRAAGSSDGRTVSRRAVDGPAHRATRCSDARTDRRAAGDLPRLAFTRLCARRLRHFPTCCNVFLGGILADGFEMVVRIEIG